MALDRRFAISGQDTNTAATSILGLTAIANVRLGIYFVFCGSDATADNAWEGTINRYTAAGTATAITPHGLDPDAPTALATAGQIHTVEPTYTAGAILLSIFQHQRAPYYFCVNKENALVIPGTAANGAGLSSITAATGFNLGSNWHYME
jgi:hypothetical protein